MPPQNDYLFHDRLTHSMKVAQVAATLARKVVYQAERDDWDAAHRMKLEEWIDPDFCYAAGLAHDIGHPPFGHAGEATLQEILDLNGVGRAKDRSFEGNAQSTHIVATLSFRKSDDDGGLNLTLRSLAAIAKYPWLRNEHPHKVSKLRKKWSFYPEEKWILTRLYDAGFVARTVSTKLTQGGQVARDDDHQPLAQVDAVYRWPEAELMDWADDISYAVHDLEDFYRAGRIPLDRVGAGLKQLTAAEEFDATATADFLKTPFLSVGDPEVRAALLFARSKMAKVRDADGNPADKHVHAAFEQIRDVLLIRFPLGRFDGSRDAHASLQNFASEAITYLSEATSIEVITVETSQRVAFRVAIVAQLVAEFFKALCHYYVIETPVLSTLQFGQGKNIEEMFGALQVQAEAWSADDEESRSLPARLREYLGQTLPGGTVRREEVMGAVQVAVADFICSLRDQQADLLADRLLGRGTSLDVAGSWLDA